jgi:ketosteroid isomerase-like protein
MASLTIAAFSQWLETYGRASRENDPRASAELFAEDARYYESPFDPPIQGRPAIYEYWNKGAQNLKDKQACFDILSVQGQRGIARWKSKFTAIQSGKHYVLDCLFLVEFDETGLCHEFREWWHLQTLDAQYEEPE